MSGYKSVRSRLPMTMHIDDVLREFIQLPFTVTIWEDTIDIAM